MRKTLLLTLEYPPMLGGISEYLGGLFSALPKDRVEVLHGSKLISGRRGLPLRWLPSLWHTWHAVRKQGTEVLVISHILPMGYVAYLLKRLRRLPYIVIVHGMDLQMAKRSRRKHRLAGTILKHAETVVTNSEYTRSLVLGFGLPEEKVKVVYPCPSKTVDKTPPAEEVEALRNKYGLAGKKVILSVGRLVKRKGFDAVIEALPDIRKTCENAAYLIVGTGPEEQVLKGLASKHHLQDHVVFTGAVNREDLPAHYGLGDVFVTVARELPGDVEGFGIVYLEAGRFGLPVIAGRTGGVPEAVQDGKTGILVDPDERDKLVGAALRFLTDENVARSFGAAGKERAEREFSCSVQLERMKALL